MHFPLIIIKYILKIPLKTLEFFNLKPKNMLTYVEYGDNISIAKLKCIRIFSMIRVESFYWKTVNFPAMGESKMIPIDLYFVEYYPLLGLRIIQ